jgi:signal transduction histidine kinase/ActR/RegA family two-component response regulator
MSSQLRRIIIRALALPCALALVVVAVTTIEILYLRSLARAVDHTQAVLGATSRLYRMIVDQETGIRGYLLTGDRPFLQPYELGHDQIPDGFREVEPLLRDNSTQLLRLEELRRVLSEWQRQVGNLVSMATEGEPGRRQAAQLAVQRDSKDRMDTIRARLDDIEADERGTLDERRRSFGRESRYLVVGGGVLALVLAALITFVLRRQIGAIEEIYRRALTEREASEERERQARGQAESASRTKDEFLATVSHELRTPLTAMLGWARLLRGHKIDEARRERALEAIERNAVAQAQLIEDLLDVSRIISGKLRLELHETDLHKLIEAAVDSVRPAMEAKRIRFQLVVDPASASVLGDPNRLQQVIWNLLSNAIKFTPKEGRVQLSLTRVSSHVELAVRDSGQGIAPEFLPRVFQRFAQADSSEARSFGGLGLGLAISRHLTELHGGTIEAASEGPGKGATFTVKLPLLPVREARRLAGPPPQDHPSLDRDVNYEYPPELAGLKVLVVDDEPDTRELLVTVVSQCGCVVQGAGSTGEALDVVPGFRPDVILSDIGMPGEDGYELVRKLRQRPPEQGGRTPAAALTAYARAEDRRQALRAGFEMHLPKPVEPAELIAALATLARIGEAMR